jgi:microcystin-dependent protein
MACSNCFNGCSEITSDQCVRYTGIDVPMLGIKSGDSLSFVEQSLIQFLTSALDGTGIHMPINSTIICNIVKDFLPTCGELSLVDFTTALIKSVCSLKVQLDALAVDVAAIEAPYTTGCLTVASGDSVTHQVVQAIITKLCTVEADLNALAINLDTNYVKLTDLCSLVIACIENNAPGDANKLYNKMVPFTVVEYYGSTSNFDFSGAGQGDWEKIYLCNGQNGTPDKRGRVGVGVTFGTGMDAVVTPGGLNPNYLLYTTAGSNGVTLTTPQIPSHSHVANSVVTEANGGHTHFCFSTASVTTGAPLISPTNVAAAELSGAGNLDYAMSADNANVSAVNGLTSKVSVGITVSTTTDLTGGSTAHANIQPVLACYYIMYIP